MDISTKDTVCTLFDEDRSVLRNDRFDKTEEYTKNFFGGGSFVIGSTGFYEPVYDLIESIGIQSRTCRPSGDKVHWRIKDEERLPRFRDNG
jgi:hypothetical protein